MDVPAVSSTLMPSLPGQAQQQNIAAVPRQRSDKPVLLHYGFWVAMIALIFVGFGATIYMLPQKIWDYNMYLLSRYILQSDYISIRNQRLTDRIVVDRLKLSKPGYAAIVFGDDFNSPGDNFPGFSQYLPVGEYKNVELDVSVANVTQNYAPQMWKRGSKAFVVLYWDDGDEEQHPESDHVATYINGDPVLASFTIL